MGKAIDLEVLHGNDVGRCSSTALTSLEDLDEFRVIVAENNTNAEGSKDEEGTKSEVDGLEGRLDVDARAFGFTGDHGDVFGADDAKGSSPKCTKKALKSFEIGIASHWTRLAPMPKTVGISLGVTATHCDEGEEVEDEDQQDLASGQPEFSFSKYLYGQDVAGTE